MFLKFSLRKFGFNISVMIISGVLLSLSLPVAYDKYQDRIDEKIHVVHGIIHPQYQKIRRIVLSIIPNRSSKEKKVQ
jgi:reticulon-3